VTASISRRLILWLAVPLMLLALCGALVHYFNKVAPGVISSDRRLREAANALMVRTKVLNSQWSLDDRADGRPPLPSADSVVYALRDAQGRLLIGDSRLPVVSLDSATSQLFSMSQFEHRYLRTLSTRFETVAGVIIVTVADAHSAEQPAARYGMMSTLLWDFVQLDVTLVLVWVGIQLGLRPMKRLRDEISERSPTDLRAIDDSSVPREIAPVVVTINRLFAMLRQSVQAQQQFISNTAHQLRTPITGMQAQLDLLIAEEAAQPVKHRLLTLQEGIRQLAHSSNQLLTLARADPAANIAAKKQTVRLDTIVGEVVARFFDRALLENIDLGINVVPVSLKADPSLLDDLLGNLVDNALKYTPAGGTVTVTVGHHDEKPYLAVEDTGVGIPPAERQRVRQRFYRMPNSPGHGSGLGLAIVDEIARIHDAALDIDIGPNGVGTRVSIRFT
jgi:two-component system, OmpR family, sensor histidine kinase TctE